MKVDAEIKKWGDSLALRMTGTMVEMPGFKEGAKVVVDVSTSGFMVKPVVNAWKRSNYHTAKKNC